jgi:HK97 gp10 family phage protein
VREELERQGEKVADRARARAPRASGAGAESIHAEIVKVGSAFQIRVAWDREHDYMFFHEVGTSKMPARPFLRPALDQ